jgi:hypothetical protein
MPCELPDQHHLAVARSVAMPKHPCHRWVLFAVLTLAGAVAVAGRSNAGQGVSAGTHSSIPGVNNLWYLATVGQNATMPPRVGVLWTGLRTA